MENGLKSQAKVRVVMRLTSFESGCYIAAHQVIPGVYAM